MPHGGTTTVRAASAVGTTTARVPGLTALTALGFLAISAPTISATINTTIVTHMARLAPGPGIFDGCCRASPWVSVASAIGLPP